MKNTANLNRSFDLHLLTDSGIFLKKQTNIHIKVAYGDTPDHPTDNLEV